jgi:cell division septal protein FtsQ
MKEQVVASRGSRRAGTQQKGFVQKPARRDGSSARGDSRFSPRALFAYVPKALKFVIALVVLIAAILGYRMAASAALFQVQAIDVSGTSRTSADEIQSLTRRALGRTGVWRADLSAISNELSLLPGVRRAVVTRVLPDRVRVRITERVPLAVIRTTAGHFVWVDDDGVMLDEMKPDDRTPAFFIRGWNEERGEDARKENIERVQKYQGLVKEWDAAGLSQRVSEVTLTDLRDVRAQLAGADSQIEVRLGSQELGERLQIALQALDTYKQTPRGSSITYVDLQTGRVVIGFGGPGNRSTTDSNNSSAGQPETSVTRQNSTTETPGSQAAQPNTGSSRKPEAGKGKKPTPQPLGNALRLH